jgi:hypothetical protein
LELSDCRACGTPFLRTIHHFEATPYGDLYANSRNSAIELENNPLVLSRCRACSLLQLLFTTDLDSQYREYLYFTSVTHKLKEFYLNIASALSQRVDLTQEDLVLDLGSNDGTFLSNFRGNTRKLLGVDPSEPACKEASMGQVEVLNQYFDSSLASTIKNKYGYPRIISCNYTIANVPNLADFFDGISMLTGDNTQINFITGYHLDQFQIGMFDYIGHDHLTYLTVQDFQKLCQSRGLKVNYARRHEHKGGSLEIGIVSTNSTFRIEDSVSQLIQREKWLNSSGDTSIHLMLNRLEQNRNFVTALLSSLKDSGTEILGTGASISTTSLLFNFRIGQFFNHLYDDDPRKIGRFSPGFGIEVQALENIHSSSSSLNVILAWQHTEKIISRLKEVGYRGLVLVPMPEVKLFKINH